MSILINKATRVICQGITGAQGTFRAHQLALPLDGGGLGGGVAAEATQDAQVGASAQPRSAFIGLRTPPSRPSPIEGEGDGKIATALHTMSPN